MFDSILWQTANYELLTSGSVQLTVCVCFVFARFAAGVAVTVTARFHVNKSECLPFLFLSRRGVKWEGKESGHS